MNTVNDNNRQLRIGAVSYLNTKPLVYGLAEMLPEAELLFDYPSRLADALAAGELDIALVPSAEMFGHPEWSVVSDACIACRGPVLSVKLLFRVPIDRVRTLALDEGSRTSAMLSQIMLRELAGVHPHVTNLPLGHEPADIDADAVLVIGDRAIRSSEEEFVEVWDLGDRWCRWAELPFVFAMWVARPGVDTSIAEKALADARDQGCQNLAQIAREQALAMQLPYDLVFEYLSRNLHFELGGRERRGLELFHEKAAAHGLVAPPLRASCASMIAQPSIPTILDKAVAGERITPSEGLRLLESHDLAALGRAADEVTRRLHPENYRTYNIDRNINYTNVCTAVCDFCAFYRTPKSNEGYTLDRGQLLQKIQETVEIGGDQILLQGGLHPDYKLEWYEELLHDIKREFPQVNVHGFSPPEIYHFTRVSKLPLETVLERLKAAGMGSLPGGGAEILVDRVRLAITRGKVLTEDWLNVNRVWHEMGGRSTATMMFGHVETLAERIEHLERLRELQDETGGFTAFICWTFQPDHTEMSHVPPAGSFEYLKTNAVARLYLDNFANLQSSWVTQGLKIGQLALLYGANDMGSLMIEENVVAEAGTVHHLTLAEIRASIEELGYEPRQRNVFYELIDSPIAAIVPKSRQNQHPLSIVS